MAVGKIQTEGDLKRFIEQQVQTPGVLPAVSPTSADGVADVPWTEGEGSGQAVVPHGLKVTPKKLFVTPKTGAFQVQATAGNENDTDFTIYIYRDDGAIPTGSVKVSWEVKS